MFDSRKFPKFVFVGDDGTETNFHPGAETARIVAAAARIRSSSGKDGCIGLLFRSEPNLILNWLACLVAGRRPLILQYPTKKQSRTYWSDSVGHTVQIAGISLILADDYCAGLGIDGVPIVSQSEIDRLPRGASNPIAVDDFSIVQLSSGTTGHRKAVEFTGDALRRHIADYNATIRLTREDRIVSWLPLYHDMGLIACFVMPMALGIDVVMMDPMTWVQRPALLFDAIERHKGTCCYMPNFGFEVMAREPSRHLPSMRWWISCSEPVSALSARKFLNATRAKPRTFAACYAMAENVFAATFCTGVKTRKIDGAEVACCGTPIKDVALKIVDNEIWLRSPTSLTGYIGSGDIRDGDGFYPTGDLGQVIDGELYVTGRKQDLLIQAGKKLMLSDIDLALNRLYPDIRGRAATVAIYDDRLGTEKPVALIETADFFLRKDQDRIVFALRRATDLDQLDVHFVPPRFLTKTSSGKFNRKKSASDWLLAELPTPRALVNFDPISELHKSFANVAWDRPVGEILDSLSLTVLRIVLSEAQVAYDDRLSLREICATLEAGKGPPTAPSAGTIRIVSLADTIVLRKLRENHLERLSARLGVPVALEQVCLPPSPVTLSDLIFMDYFRPRLNSDAFASVETAFAKLRDASLILVDDFAEMYFPPLQVYGALSHNLERHPDADLVAVRWQRYPQFQDRLPITIVSGADLPLEHRSEVLRRFGAYIQKPVFRIATLEGFAKFTGDWEYRRYAKSPMAALDPDDLIEHLVSWIEKLPHPLHRSAKPPMPAIDLSDMRHYCSHFVDQASIDRALARFDSFCIAGQSSSIPYVRRRLEQLGKSFVAVPSYAPQVLESVKQPFDCVLTCGAMGRYRIDHPAIALMANGAGWSVKNIADPAIRNLTFDSFLDNPPPTAPDWFHTFPLERDKNWREVSAAREALEIAKDLPPPMRKRLARRRARRESLQKGVPVQKQPQAIASQAQPYYQDLSKRIAGKKAKVMAAKAGKAKQAARKAAPGKDADEQKVLRRRKAYIVARIASLREELRALSEERSQIDAKISADPKSSEAKALHQRKIYVIDRPSGAKTEIKAIASELREVNEKLKSLKAAAA